MKTIRITSPNDATVSLPTNPRLLFNTLDRAQKAVEIILLSPVIEMCDKALASNAEYQALTHEEKVIYLKRVLHDLINHAEAANPTEAIIYHCFTAVGIQEWRKSLDIMAQQCPHNSDEENLALLEGLVAGEQTPAEFASAIIWTLYNESNEN